MTVAEIAQRLGLAVAAGGAGLGRVVSGGHAGDLPSEALAQARAGQVWLTIQGHETVVAVAVHKRLAAVILAGGRRPEPEAAARAEAEGLPILTSGQGVFELAGRLRELGL